MQSNNIIEWDYLGWKEHLDKKNQNDWNETLLSAINQISGQIQKSSLQFNIITINCNENVYEIIKNLSFFDQKNETLLNIKINKIINYKANSILIYNYSSLPFVLFPINENKLKLDFIFNVDEETAINYIKNSFGEIKIKNYE